MTEYAKLLQLVNQVAEETTIKGMCQGDMQTAFAISEMLESSDYYDQRYQVMFLALQNLLRSIEPIDTAAIVAECKSVANEYNLKVLITPDMVERLTGDVTKAVAYAQTVKRLSWLRSTADFAYWLVKELQAQPAPEELFVAAQERFQVLQPKLTNDNFVYGWDTVKMQAKTLEQRVKDAQEQTGLRFDWPWHSWNNIIRPLRGGMVGILAAADGMGKTTFLEQVAEYWAECGYQTVYVHLEDALDYKLDRRTARQALVEMNHIEDGTLTAEEWRKVEAADQRMAQWACNLHYYHAAGKCMGEIVRELESRISEGVCQAVVFDYLDKVQPSRGQAKLFGDNTWERQAADMESLKTFAEKANIPVFTATQGNKSMQNGGTQTRQNIQGSGQKSQKAQLVIILSRDIVGDGGLYDSDNVLLAEAGEYSPIVNVRVDKQNRGRTGGFKQYLAGKYFTVRDIERRPLES